MQDEWHLIPWWGVGALLRVVAGTDPEEAFGPPVLIGHHANWAARGYGTAVWELRKGRSPSGSIAEADHLVRHTPVHRHMLRTTIAPVVPKRAWSRWPRAGCERPTHSAVRPNAPCNVWSAARSPRSAPKSRRVQHQLVPPHLARLGITARETDSAACQRRPEQCRHLPSPVHIDQNRGVPRQQHAAKGLTTSGNSCRQPVPLRTEPHNLSLRLAISPLQRCGVRLRPSRQRLGVARENDVPVPIRRRGQALRWPTAMASDGSWQHQRHAVVVPALLKGIAGDAVDQH